MGGISAAHPGYREKDFLENTLEANKRALHDEIQKAKHIAKGKGLVGVNIMVAIKDYEEMVRQAVKSGADAIISGAGLPLALPKYVGDSPVLLAPIVSSGRVAELICKSWDKKYHRVPDFIVIEGSDAGGHLGFDKEALLNHAAESLDTIFKKVKEAIAPYQEKYNIHIPVFVAGGIDTNEKVKHYMQLGADGVQVATRFIPTYECDASENYKQMFLSCNEEDIEIVQSPVGMPGRAMKTKLTNTIANGERIPVQHCFNCLKPCNPGTTPYCISMALIQAAKGNIDEGLVFCGSQAFRIRKMMHVDEVISELMEGIA